MSLLRQYAHMPDALLQLSRKYGNFFRIWAGPTKPVVVVAEPELIKSILITDKASYELPRRSLLIRSTGWSVLTASGALWKRQRSLMQPAFHFQQLRNMMPIFQEETMKFLGILQQFSETGEYFNMNQWLSRLTLQVIGRSAFGIDTQALSGKPTGLGLAMMKLGKNSPLQTAVAMGLPFYARILEHIPTSGVKLVRKYAEEVVRERVREADVKESEGKEDEMPHDLLGLLVACKDEQGKRMSVEQMVNEAITFLLAGHETTSTFMTWFVYALSQAPAVDARLYQELRQTVDIRPPTYDEVSTFEYMRQCIDEVFRVYPPVPLLGRQCCQDTELGGQFIPQGTTVVLPPYVLHRNPLHFPDPDVFMPERHAKAAAKNVLMPFSLGERHCIGQYFALLEMKIILSQLFVRFRFELQPNFDPKPDYHLVLRPQNGMMVRVIRR
eukprot:TRINITY_DN1901_c0_g1_i4.p1 TRINITY_DN1901_c0_g1~~TRINITY_DN1901_c0_g1_i4.p1  ORF type:complete len:507 (+),score=91.44 TRINITY_DN1901_c0_g1_i4:201-1523(+)